MFGVGDDRPSDSRVCGVFDIVPNTVIGVEFWRVGREIKERTLPVLSLSFNQGDYVL